MSDDAIALSISIIRSIINNTSFEIKHRHAKSHFAYSSGI